MTSTRDKRPDDRDAELLLPWHAAGTLGRHAAQRMDAVLAQDADLARQLALVREELVETIHINEAMGAPSTRAMERVFAQIEYERATARKPRRGSPTPRRPSNQPQQPTRQ